LPGSGEGQAAGEAGAAAENPTAQQLTKLLAEKVKSEPANASRMVDSWVRGDGK
jgi:hypothetical protein